MRRLDAEARATGKCCIVPEDQSKSHILFYLHSAKENIMLKNCVIDGGTLKLIAGDVVPTVARRGNGKGAYKLTFPWAVRCFVGTAQAGTQDGEPSHTLLTSAYDLNDSRVFYVDIVQAPPKSSLCSPVDARFSVVVEQFIADIADK